MRSQAYLGLLVLTAFNAIPITTAKNLSIVPWGVQQSLLPRQLTTFDERPPNCPPCFNCNLEDFKCQQFGDCSVANGKCRCPEGFGGEDCSQPLCGSLADGQDRAPRAPDQKYCDCPAGWEGINCNVCQTDQVCNALQPDKKDGVCYKGGVVQKQNYQQCDVTNKKIVDGLDPRRPQVTFSCTAEDHTCDFQCKYRRHARLLVYLKLTCSQSGSNTRSPFTAH